MRDIKRTDLRDLLTGLPYDFVVVDTAPTYDGLVLAGITAADTILTPARFTRFDYKGAYFVREQLRSETDKLDAWRLLFNFYKPARTDNPDANRNLFETMFRDTFGDAIAPVTIPETALVARAIDTAEKITGAASKAALHGAIEALAAYCGASRAAGRF
jgi:cellulose biosynthesis protein BcsQ